MRKRMFPLYLLSILIIIAGCNSKVSVESLGIPITDNMTVKETYESSEEGQNIIISTYTLENEILDTFLANYEQTLNEKGWSTINNLKPRGLIMEKNGQNVTLILYEESNQLLLDIIPTPKIKAKK